MNATQQPGQEDARSALEQFGINLTDRARQGKLDPWSRMRAARMPNSGVAAICWPLFNSVGVTNRTCKRVTGSSGAARLSSSGGTFWRIVIEPLSKITAAGSPRSSNCATLTSSTLLRPGPNPSRANCANVKTR